MIIQFPIKKQIKLTEEQEKKIELFAHQYVQMLNDICKEMGIDENSKEEETAEVMNLVLGTLLDGFNKALDEI